MRRRIHACHMRRRIRIGDYSRGLGYLILNKYLNIIVISFFLLYLLIKKVIMECRGSFMRSRSESRSDSRSDYGSVEDTKLSTINNTHSLKE
jgi:hypothetical protein